jgi:hypothetical protein
MHCQRQIIMPNLADAVHTAVTGPPYLNYLNYPRLQVAVFESDIRWLPTTTAK